MFDDMHYCIYCGRKMHTVLYQEDGLDFCSKKCLDEHEWKNLQREQPRLQEVVYCDGRD